ncbi:MAG: c-type cytochrome, partial [Gemmataceae bacterium]
AALTDPAPRVRAQALISLGRLQDRSVAKSIVPLASRPKGSTMPDKRPAQNQPDADRVLPHLAVRALVALEAVEPCLEALDGPHAEGALWALRYLHNPRAVDGLIKKLAAPGTSSQLRRQCLATLIRLYHREADYKGSWWGIRPDSTGPYYERVTWGASERIGAVIKAALLDADADTSAFLKKELARHKVSLPGLPATLEPVAEKEVPITLLKVDPRNADQIGNLTFEAARTRALRAKGDATRGAALFKAQSCLACHTFADGQTPKGPHLVDIGKRYQPEELVESILKPSAKLAQGYEAYRFIMQDGRIFSGFVVSEGADAILIRESNSVQRMLPRADIETRQQLKESAMPEQLVANLTPEQLADLIAYLQSLK